MTSFLTQIQQTQILTTGAKRLMQAIQTSGGEARIVGGAVRDALMGRDIGDIDLAMTLTPEKAIEACRREHIKTVPTGIDYGTITAVVDGVGYEITSLRMDIQTDGRHAKVSFTDDWRADAKRRDFTLNALYVDAAGMLYDFFDGQRDAKEGYIRFIGDPRERILEDVLRILRFFRFYGWFGKGAADQKSLQACYELKDLLPRLSQERVAKEILKLLASPNPLPAWILMNDGGLTPFFLEEAKSIEGLQRLVSHEQEFAVAHHSSLTRLASLIPRTQEAATTVSARLKLSNHDAEKLLVLATLPLLTADAENDYAFRQLLYSFGPDACRAAVFLQKKVTPDKLKLIDLWENPVFPLKGQDAISMGLRPGRDIGEILREVEDWWKAGDFKASRDACLCTLQEFTKSHLSKRDK